MQTGEYIKQASSEGRFNSWCVRCSACWPFRPAPAIFAINIKMGVFITSSFIRRVGVIGKTGAW